jgi:hypothetical protein
MSALATFAVDLLQCGLAGWAGWALRGNLALKREAHLEGRAQYDAARLDEWKRWALAQEAYRREVHNEPPGHPGFRDWYERYEEDRLRQAGVEAEQRVLQGPRVASK